MSEGMGGFALKEPIWTQNNVSHPRKRKDDGDARYLEDGLHLVELSPGMLSREHLDDQATDAPYISLLRVCDLFDDFWSHPIDGALEGRTVKAIPWHEILQNVTVIPRRRNRRGLTVF